MAASIRSPVRATMPAKRGWSPSRMAGTARVTTAATPRTGPGRSWPGTITANAETPRLAGRGDDHGWRDHGGARDPGRAGPARIRRRCPRRPTVEPAATRHPRAGEHQLQVARREDQRVQAAA